MTTDERTTATAATTAATAAPDPARRLPVGAEVTPAGVHLRVWAPKRRKVEAVFEGGATLTLAEEAGGHFSGLAEGAAAGALYRFRLDGEEHVYPDPASRFQPDGPHGPSQVIDPSTFAWTDDGWAGVTPHGQVLYEMHLGTFTPEGTWAAAMRELPRLRDVGITCLEVMPVNEFAGRFGWGYDGVDLFAPFHHYGPPDDARRFVDEAHRLGLGVILDVVYNHLGPDGNCLRAFADEYFSRTHRTDWGEAMNFDGPGSAGAREFVLANARHWIDEYRFDGLRVDATQAIVDDSPRHILAEVAEAARAAARSRGRSVYLVCENEPQHARLVGPTDAGGLGMDALWNDDFHHSAMVALTGRAEAYYTDYRGTAQEFVSAARYGYLYQGQRYRWQRKRRGTPAFDLPPTAFVHFIQNHDQVANGGRGLRADRLASAAQLRAMTALLLLGPQTPMLFQGQEYAASRPFHYFADHRGEISPLVCRGRAREMAQFPSIATPEMQACLVDPCSEATFVACKLDLAERDLPGHAEVLLLHGDLLRLRREEPAFRRVQRRGDLDGAVLSHDAFVLRYFDDAADDRLLLVNFGRDLELTVAPEPLLAPPLGRRWAILWSSEDPRYGGSGTPPPDTEQEGWFLPARCAMVLRPLPVEQAEVATRVREVGSAQDAKLLPPCS